ncbi:hypothetical protein [Streptomyces subrutilus]
MRWDHLTDGSADGQRATGPAALFGVDGVVTRTVDTPELSP